jgi:hypothetical protein
VRVGNGLALVDNKVLVEDLEDLGWMVKSVEVNKARREWPGIAGKNNSLFFFIKRFVGVWLHPRNIRPAATGNGPTLAQLGGSRRLAGVVQGCPAGITVVETQSSNNGKDMIYCNPLCPFLRCVL